MASPKPFSPWEAARVDQVVRLWNAGLSAPDIARRLGTSRHSVESKIAKLRRAGVSLAHRRSRAAAISPYARRRCLHCDHPFDSEHIGNRICPICLIDGPFTSAMV
jgi:hypothetical protein